MKQDTLLPEQADPRFVAVEANLLRLPLFALHTKGLKTLDGIECKGFTDRDGQTHQFVFRAYRNTSTFYPGPLSRSVHLAFLDVVSEMGLPFENPLTWGWRDLCRRIGIQYSGRTLQHLKGAILAVKGLLIHSEYAIYSRAEKRLLCTREAALGLYETVVFQNQRFPEGGEADTNYLWLSSWYLANLNAFFTAPLDYCLWKRLEQRSPIASRLYEFLLLNFCSDIPLLRINYPNLAQMLPVTRMNRVSKVREQLDGPFAILKEHGLIDAVNWVAHKKEIAQLHIFPGRALPRAGRAAELPDRRAPEEPPAIEVKELRNVRPPEWGIVAEFYRLWTGQQFPKPSPKELQRARELIEEHGEARLKALIPIAVERMRVKWPDAKTFNALDRYLPDAARQHDRGAETARRKETEQQRFRQQREEAENQKREDEAFRAKWRPVWDNLPEGERDRVRAGLVGKNPLLANMPSLLEIMCLNEVARRNS